MVRQVLAVFFLEGLELGDRVRSRDHLTLRFFGFEHVVRCVCCNQRIISSYGMNVVWQVYLCFSLFVFPFDSINDAVLFLKH